MVLLPKAEVAAFGCRVVWLGMADDFPCYCVGGAVFFQFPNVFAEFCTVFLFLVDEA